MTDAVLALADLNRAALGPAGAAVSKPYTFRRFHRKGSPGQDAGGTA